MPRRIRLPVIKDGKCLLKLATKHKLQVLKRHLGYMPICYNRLTKPGLWAEAPVELWWEITRCYDGFKEDFWHKDLRVIDNWNDDPEQIERWNHAKD